MQLLILSQETTKTLMSLVIISSKNQTEIATCVGVIISEPI